MSYIEQLLKTPNKPASLYHYTSQEGLLGIIKSNELWATKVHYMNDSKEYKLALELVQDELNRREEGASIQLKSKISTFRKRISWIEKVHICVCSFTPKSDLLSQWRGYGNSGIGYSIGFDFDSLKGLASSKNFILVPCVYEKQEQLKIIKELVDNALKGKTTYEIEPNNVYEVKGFEDYVAMLAPIIKDKSFSEEREWRLISPLIHHEDPALDFRPGKTSLIPYYKFSIKLEGDDNSAIKRIVVGPTPHQELSQDALQSFLNKNKCYDNVVIRSSRIPYRHW